MEIIKYKYSVYQTWFAVILLSTLILSCLYAIKTDSPGDNIWQLMAPGALFLAVILAYVCYKFLLPLIRRETILELDKDKLQYAVKHTVVLWKDIDSINYVIGVKTGSWSIRFVMKDGSRDKKISTKYVAGDNKTIYNTIVDYYEKYK